MAMLKHVFPIMLLLVAVLIAPAVHASADVVPLEYDHFGNLLPGYKYYVRLHGVAVVALIGSSFADAVLQIGVDNYGLVGDDGLTPVHVYRLVNGQKTEIDTVWQGIKEYDMQVTVTAYCPGENPVGAPYELPDDTWMWTKIELDNGATYWEPVQIEDGVGPEVKGYYESTLGEKSWVHVESKVKFEDCDVKVIGDDPTGSDTRHDNDTTYEILQWLKDLGTKIAYALVGLIAVAVILPILLKR